MQVSYFSYEGAKGAYFRCDRYGTMNTDRCSSNYRSAPDEVRLSGRLDGCIGCKVGALHSGGELTIAPVRPGWCVRCRRGPEEYNTKGGAKGFGRVRLVNGGVCVSCANRQYEVAKGANAKGDRPKKWASLGPHTVGVIEADQIVTMRENVAIDRIEVGLIALRRNVRAIAMCWVAAGLLQPIPRAPMVEQLALFDGGGQGRRPLRAAPTRIELKAAEQFSLFSVEES